MWGLVVVVVLAALAGPRLSGPSPGRRPAAVNVMNGYVPPPPLDAGPAPWRLPNRGGDRVAAAGLPAYRASSGPSHVHAHLDVFVDGRPVLVPEGIGFGPPMGALHTHSASGILHFEPDDGDAHVRLGQFFTLWGVRMTGTCVGVYCAPRTSTKVFVDGIAQAGPAPDVELLPYREIAVVVGSPPASIPAGYDCHDAAPVEQESCRGFLTAGAGGR